MILDWDKRITDLCNNLGFAPELYNEDEQFMEWVARHFGFKDYATFQALASVKDILGGMALDMLSDHKNFVFYLIEDCIELIEHNYELYDDDDRTRFEIENFLQFAQDNFYEEMIILSVKKLATDAECITKFLPSSDIYLRIRETYSHLLTKETA